MRKRDKEVIEIGECTSLAFVIDRLQAFSRSLRADSHPEVTIGGNDYFGWRLTISFFREMTPEEAALEAKYSLPQPDAELSCLQPERLGSRAHSTTGSRATAL